MDLISEFISRYSREIDYYEKSAKMIADLIEASLRSEGVRAIVTSRAKNPGRLEEKTRNRALKKEYKNINDIYKDIVDLAGVRVALYFPGEIDKVGRIIESICTIDGDPIIFKGTSKNDYPKARFSGYWAHHYRVFLRDNNLNESQKRYTEARVEVQVASVLMHAWSEVEHDLVYKPLQGKLSDEEYAILDELNGLVLSGEISLERLQKAGELRASTSGRRYENHYDLAASLVELTRATINVPEVNDSTMGRVDLLYKILKRLEIDTPDSLSTYLKALHGDLDKRPLSEQVIDQILAEDKHRYGIYDEILSSDKSFSPSTTSTGHDAEATAIKEFLDNWVDFEDSIKNHQSNQLSAANIIMLTISMQAMGFKDKDIESAQKLRRFRNQLVHRKVQYAVETIMNCTQEIKRLVKISHTLNAAKEIAK